MGWRAVGDALPLEFAGIMTVRGTAPFMAPHQAKAQVQRGQRVWLGTCCPPTRPACRPEQVDAHEPIRPRTSRGPTRGTMTQR
eukprot:689120-Alexandrium_andersonii.AAC.1